MAPNSVGSGLIWPKFKLVREFMPLLVTCRFEKDLITNNRERWTSFSPLKGAFCCHGNHSFDPICPKTLCSLSPTIMMLHIKFDQDWPTGLRDIQVSCELRRNDRMTEGQGNSSIAPLFQSGALIISYRTVHQVITVLKTVIWGGNSSVLYCS